MTAPTARRRLASLALLVAAPALAGLGDSFVVRTLSLGYRPGTLLTGPAQSTADGDWTVAAFCEPVEDRWCWIVAFPRDGVPAVELSGALWVPGSSPPSFLLAPNGRRVVYLRRENAAAPQELWSRPIDGSTAAVRLRAADADDVLYKIHFTPSGQAVCFVHRRPGVEEELRIVPVAGGSGRVLDTGDFDGQSLAFDPAGAQLVYWNRIDGVTQLRAVALAGGAARTLDAIELEPFADASQPIVTPDGQRVVFAAGLADPDVVEVWSVPLAGPGPRVRLSAALAEDSDISDLEVSTAGRAVYRWQLDSSSPYRLSSAPVDGSAAATFVDGGLVAGGSVHSMAVAGGYVAFVADAAVDEKRELWSASVDGSTPRTRRSAVLAADRDVSNFEVAPDALRVVYRADGTSAGRNDLYSTTVSGFTTILRLSNLELSGDDYDAMSYTVAGDSRTVVYETIVDGQFDGRLVIQDLREPTIAPASLTTWGSPVLYAPLDDGAAVRFAADRIWDSRIEIHLADRRFFADGFESGDTAGWSATVP